MKKLFAIVFTALVGVAVLGQTQPADAQVVYGTHCCNQAGYVVCGGTPLPLNTACCCAGVGCGGYVCP